ncbi:unnamed protein product [Clonostachys byssicola]|uniref:DUF7580 domain-containing protein n=1 Tax=Clonostachys byssicola TaxID=160290 RepID=A0A9N9Y5Z4_9HYPO|nr:unnamed protein product [Clonostachys byssicola]
MFDNLEHHDWGDVQLEKSVGEIMSSNYEECNELIKDIFEMVKKFESELDHLEVFQPDEKQAEKSKDTRKRIREGLILVMNESNYESRIKEIKEASGTLTWLRQQIIDLKKPSQRVESKKPLAKKALWTKIRHASTALHRAMAGTWTCSQASQMPHFIKLFVEANEADSDVQLKIAMLAHDHSGKVGVPRIIKLQIRSRMTLLYPRIPRIPSPDSSDERPRKLRKFVRFDFSASTPCAAAMAGRSETKSGTSSDISPDLRNSKDLCGELMQRYDQATIGIDYCVGHIDFDAEECNQHLFYLPDNLHRAPTLSVNQLITMDTLVGFTQEIVAPIHKLKIARSLALAVLRFHGTPWLREIWKLGDLSFFYHEDSLSKSLQTLHLGAEFELKRLTRNIEVDAIMDNNGLLTPHGSQTEEEERVTCGINNMTLHCLGVALLHIDRGTQLDPGNVLRVRKMAHESSTLGSEYRDITQQCLRCDFGVGCDLSQDQLQRAVYGSIVERLESMILRLEPLYLEAP